MKKKILVAMLIPCCVMSQDIHFSTDQIPLQMLGYNNDSVRGMGSNLRSSALPALRGIQLSIVPATRYNIQGSGSIGLMLASGNGMSGKKLALAADFSPVHQSIKTETGYGMMINKFLSLGVTIGITATKTIGIPVDWRHNAEIGFIYQLNKKVSWGAHYHQTRQLKTITSGILYHLNEQIQLVAEIEKGTQRWFGFTVMLSSTFNEEWFLSGGYKAPSSSPFCHVSHLRRKLIFGAGLALHPLLGSSFQLTFSKLMQ